MLAIYKEHLNIILYIKLYIYNKYIIVYKLLKIT